MITNDLFSKEKTSFLSQLDQETEINIKYDPSTQLCAIIAIHNLNRGPALGGCRWLPYLSLGDALYDAVRLAKGMSYKAAISRLPYGGGKAVLLKPKNAINKKEYFKSFASFVEQMNGKYITTADSSLNTPELDLISKYTNFVTGQTFSDGVSGCPSSFTAEGVLRGIEAAVKFKLNRDRLEGLHIAIQGIGNVGYHLVRKLYARGAKLTVCDTNPALLNRCTEEFHLKTVEPQDIYSVACDVFSPCALGGVLNPETISRLNTLIIAGSANNQLKSPEDGGKLAQKNILYAPDYVINAGGLIKVAAQYDNTPLATVEEKINAIHDKLLNIFVVASSKNSSTNLVADEMAAELLK